MLPGGISMMTRSRQLLSQTVSFEAEATAARPPAPSAPDSDTEISWSPGATERTAVVGSFEVTSRKNIDITVDVSDTAYSNLYLQLVNDGTGEVRKEIVGYGKRWSRTYESPGPGQYTLYAIPMATEGWPAEHATGTVTENVADMAWPWIVSFLLLGGPILLAVLKVVRAVFTE